MSKNTSGKTIKPGKKLYFKIFEELFSHFSEKITTGACIVKICILLSLSLKCLINRVVFLLASWVIHNDHYYGSFITS